MKKLMVMIGAAAASFGLYADPSSYSFSFEPQEGGEGLEVVTDTSWYPTTAWTSLAGLTSPLALTEYTGAADKYGYTTTERRDFPLDGDSNDQYLHLETASNAQLTRTVGYTFLDQLVKFTGYEEAPTIGDDAKIAVWLKATETEDEVAGETNLYITVGKDEGGAVAQKTALKINGTYLPDTWYRLTIKCIGNVFDSEATGYARDGYIVYIDGQQVATDDTVAKAIVTAGTLTSTASAAMQAGKLFPAIASGTAGTTIASVSYTGTGSIDDIVADNGGPAFAATVDFNFTAIDDMEITKVTLADGTPVSGSGWGPYTAAPGAELKVTLHSTDAQFLFKNGKDTYVVASEVAEGEVELDAEETETFEALVQNGTKYYLTLNDAMASAADNDVIKLLGDLTDDFALTARVDVASSVVIDLNECAIEPTTACGNGSAFNIMADVKNVVISNGVIDATAITTTECDAITARAGADVTLYDLEITINSKNGACAYAFDGAKITIKSGTYVNETDETYEYRADFKAMLVNQANVADQLVTIEGGKFKGQNPADGDDAGLCTTFLAEGLTTTKDDDGYWVVGEPKTYVAQIGENKYESFDAALAAAEADDTITLLADIETAAAQQWTIAKNITLDFNGKTITKTVANHWVFTVANGATVVFKDSTGDVGGIKHYPTQKNQTSPASMIQNKGNLTIKSGKYESDFCVIKNDEDPGAGVLTVDGGVFTVVAAAQGYSGNQWALMNWATATINGGTWTGVIGTRSCDKNKVSKSGTTVITGGTGATYLLFVGYPNDTTYEYVPKIKGVAKSVVTVGQVATITDELEAVEDGEYITVQKKSAVEPVTPGKDVSYDTEEAAKAATNNFEVAVPTAVASKVTDQTAYKAMFKPVITESSGKYVVSAEFTDTAKADLQADVNTATTSITISTIAGATGASDIAVEKSVPGLYYQMNTASDLGSFSAVKEVIGDGSAITFEGVAKPDAAKGFYKVSVSAAPVITNE